MTSGREELRYARGLETGFGKAKGSPQARATGTDDDSIVFVVLMRNSQRYGSLGWESAVGSISTYNDGVFAANVYRSLLRS